MIRIRQSLITALLVLAPLSARAGDWSEPVAQFARTIARAVGAGAAGLTVRNASSLGVNDMSSIRSALSTELNGFGVRPVNAGGVPLIAVTLSENARGYVWVAEIRRVGAKEPEVLIKEVPRIEAAPINPALAVTLRRTLLWGQSAEPILDAIVVREAAGRSTIVLEPERVLVVTSGDPQRTQQQAPQRIELDIAHARPWPRDVRGRLTPAADHLFDAYLPGVVCAAATTSPLTMNCREGDDPWPLPARQAGFYGAARNFFTGALSPGIGNQSSVTPFYSAAAVEPATPNRSTTAGENVGPPAGDKAVAPATTWFFAAVDGSVHEAGGGGERVLGLRDWGSGIASVKSDCGTLLLVSGNGDSTAPDTVRAYGTSGRELVAASAPLEFAGPVTALWPAADGSAATAITHNLTTDKYEAFTLTAACSQ